MKRSIEKLRWEYGNEPLLEANLELDPYLQFQKWLDEAIHAEVFEANGMVLSTVSTAGRASSRTVLLKQLDKRGFCFFTNYQSRKGEHLALHPYGSLTFWWKEIYRQVNIEGGIKKMSRKESLNYFRQRPRGAQLAAVASHQSAPLASRQELEEAYSRLEKKYRGKEIPCPKEWGGYRLVAERIEFWQGRANRLHDRFLYVKENGSGNGPEKSSGNGSGNSSWLLTRLSP